MLGNRGCPAWMHGDDTQATTLLEESLTLSRKELNDMITSAQQALLNLGNLFQGQGNAARSWALFEESLALSRAVGHRVGSANALVNMADLALKRFCDYAGGGGTVGEECLFLARDSGFKDTMAIALLTLGEAAWRQDQFTRARVLCGESLTLFLELGSKFGIAYGGLEGLVGPLL